MAAIRRDADVPRSVARPPSGPTFLQVLQGLVDVHRQARTLSDAQHRFSSRRVIVFADGTVKIAEFALPPRVLRTSEEQAGVDRAKVVRAAHCLSPEAVRGARLTAQDDVWCLGAIVAECVLGRRPFEARGHAEALLHVCKATAIPFPPATSRNCVDFVAACRRPRFWERPGAAELLQHPYIAADAASLAHVAAFLRTCPSPQRFVDRASGRAKVRCRCCDVGAGVRQMRSPRSTPPT